MRAARYYGPKDIRIEEIDKPVPKSEQVVVKVSKDWGGWVCGTDLHAYLAETLKFPTATEPDPITGETLPITMGHEFSGTIDELGPGEIPKNGGLDRGSSCREPIFSCMKETCRPCSTGSRNTCPFLSSYGIGGGGGGLAEFIAVEVGFVHKLPENVSLEVGACIEPLAVAWHTVERSKYTKGQTALILGAGPIGLFVLKVLRAIDPTSTIIVSEPTRLRRDQALKHGASIVVDPTVSDTRKVVLEATRDGVDVAFDAAGVQGAIDAAVFSVRTKGKVVNVAIWEAGHEGKVNLSYVAVREIEIIGVISYENNHRDVIAALADGRIANVEDLITRKIALEEVVEKGFEVLLKDKDLVGR
ncbi:hypothetical protein AMATHDRAFT_149132 [Amanita thiersii Skay4041]|uniref:Enoyl reductase (ER) domain-containing protein n=1 Tax=Amanita thiersii Skay4041 TaxID=703135 RepID=A0A2A9NKJ1_9AGAR|nr:hypothetical protein AMATHDRAFT_149132 [Amanita thiersii Skay4041]